MPLRWNPAQGRTWAADDERSPRPSAGCAEVADRAHSVARPGSKPGSRAYQSDRLRRSVCAADGSTLVPRRIGSRLDGFEPEAPLRVRGLSGKAIEVRVNGRGVRVARMCVATVHVRLPEFH